jgi:hypothetical protein
MDESGVVYMSGEQAQEALIKVWNGNFISSDVAVKLMREAFNSLNSSGKSNYYEVYRDSVDGLKLTSGYFTSITNYVVKVDGFEKHIIQLQHSNGVVRMLFTELVDVSMYGRENSLTFVVYTK